MGDKANAATSGYSGNEVDKMTDSMIFFPFFFFGTRTSSPDPHIILCNGEKPAFPMHFSLDII